MASTRVFNCIDGNIIHRQILFCYSSSIDFAPMLDLQDPLWILTDDNLLKWVNLRLYCSKTPQRIKEVTVVEEVIAVVGAAVEEVTGVSL